MTEESLIARVGMIELVKYYGSSLKNWKLASLYNPETDEIWAWDSGGWKSLSGRRGYVLLRDGKILYESIKLTQMS